jgi:hypothetical protein
MAKSKRGENSSRASSLYQKSKAEWTKIFLEEVNKEKTKNKPQMPKAAKRASSRYKSKRLTWKQALKKTGSITKKTVKK